MGEFLAELEKRMSRLLSESDEGPKLSKIETLAKIKDYVKELENESTPKFNVGDVLVKKKGAPYKYPADGYPAVVVGVKRNATFLQVDWNVAGPIRVADLLVSVYVEDTNRCLLFGVESKWYEPFKG